MRFILISPLFFILLLWAGCQSPPEEAASISKTEEESAAKAEQSKEGFIQSRPEEEVNSEAVQILRSEESPKAEAKINAASINVSPSPPKRDSQAAVGQSNKFIEVERGIELFDGKLILSSGEDISASVAVVRINLIARQIKIAASGDQKAFKGRTLEAYVKNDNARVGISGGFLKSFDPPLAMGLLKTSRGVLNRPASTGLLNGLLAIDNEGVKVLRFEDLDTLYERSMQYREALQSGPVFVWEGKPSMVRQSDVSDIEWKMLYSNHIRAFIGLDINRKILLGLTIDKVNLETLGKLLAQPITDGGLDCKYAMNLSGASSAGLLIARGEDFDRYGESRWVRLANAILIK